MITMEKGKTLGLIFVVIICGLGAGIVLPELFSNLVTQQNADNQPIMSSMRILMMIFVFFIVGGVSGAIVGDINV